MVVVMAPMDGIVSMAFSYRLRPLAPTPLFMVVLILGVMTELMTLPMVFAGPVRCHGCYHPSDDEHSPEYGRRYHHDYRRCRCPRAAIVAPADR